MDDILVVFGAKNRAILVGQYLKNYVERDSAIFTLSMLELKSREYAPKDQE